MRTNGERRPDEILAEIDRTRGEMDRTLSAIEHRLTPGQLVDQGVDYLRHSGATEFVQNLGGAARQNPLPVALASIGIAWLMALGRQPARHQGYGANLTSGSAGSGMRESIGSMKERASKSYSSMRDRASGAMSSLTGTTRQQYERARGSLDYLMNEQPLLLGAIGLAIGAALGAAAPRTRKEEELMGEASRNLQEKAKETVKQAASSQQDGKPQQPVPTQQKPHVHVPAGATPEKKGGW